MGHVTRNDSKALKSYWTHSPNSSVSCSWVACLKERIFLLQLEQPCTVPRPEWGDSLAADSGEPEVLHGSAVLFSRHGWCQNLPKKPWTPHMIEGFYRLVSSVKNIFCHGLTDSSIFCCWRLQDQNLVPMYELNSVPKRIEYVASREDVQ